jgi:O-antigen/teichoic acid export membrane protein
MRRDTILTNSFWYGIEMAADLIFGLLASVAIARVMGPERLGYYVYLVFLTNVAGKLAGFGGAEAARKYISEYLAADQPGLARAVFFKVLQIQTLLAIVVPAIAIGAMFIVGDPEYRFVALLLMLAMAPSFIGAVPALANVAAENFSRNVRGALFGLLSYVTVVSLTLIFDWGLIGLASGVLIRRSVETSVRLLAAVRWMRALPRAGNVPLLTRKLLTFSGQAICVTMLTLVVWDRSEIVFLKHFSDVKQLAYYSVAFSLTEYILMIPNVIGGATGAALMTAFGRGGSHAGILAASAIRRLAIVIVPVHLGIAAVGAAAIKVTYGSAYVSAIPALAVAAVLSLPKGLYWLPQHIMQAADKQGTMLRWLGITAVLNLVLDAMLIPPFGAIGAAVGNGLAQSFGVIVLTVSAGRLCGMVTPWKYMLRVLFCGLIMLGPTVALTVSLPPALALPTAVFAGVITYVAALRVTRAVPAEDADALRALGANLPAPLKAAFFMAIRIITPSSALQDVEEQSYQAAAS